MTNEFSQRFLSLRRAVIKDRYCHLNEMQQAAVLHTEGPLLLLAGAGSGKTTVLINRIANIMQFGCAAESGEIPDFVQEDDVAFLETYLRTKRKEDEPRVRALCSLRPAAPWNIIAITFTNKAANELKSRLETMLGPEARDVWAMTFHAACCRILRRDIDRLGYSSSFTIYDTSDSERVLKDIVKTMHLDEKAFSARYVLSVISKAKDQRQNPADYAKTADLSGDYRLEKIAQVYAEYQSRLKSANALDFDDILLKTVELLEQFEDVRTFYQRKFRYVLIDEYQDTNLLQYQLSSLLAGGWENICVVGDDDQSIYKFRGASIQNILEFEHQYRGAQLIRLEQNYRSTQSILNAANAVIAHNRGRKGKTLWTKNPQGDSVRVYEALNETDEANYVSSSIFALKQKNVPFNSFAVLYRTNAQSNAMEYSFKRNGIPYRIIGGTRFFDRAEVKDMLSYLTVINNRADDLRLNRILNNPPRGIGAKTIEIITRQAAAASLPLYEIIKNVRDYPSLEKSASKLLAFSDMIEQCAELLYTLDLPNFYEEVLIRTGYLAMLNEKDDFESQSRAENVRELKSSIVSYVENTNTPTLSGFLEEIALYTDIEQYDADADAVVMMTMHSAKGLEFPNVYLVGFEEGLFPGMRALSDPEELEEERRLCYVAITRAKQHLTISHARQRMLYGRTSANMPSRFLEEIPNELLSKSSAFSSAEPMQKHSYSPGYDQEPFSFSTMKKPRREYSAFGASSSKKSTVSYSKGDMVRHKTFGQGLVLTVLPMGNDAMLEIAFDGVGTKKLMANTASAHMSKI